MKKIFGISLIAVLAVSPLMANAAAPAAISSGESGLAENATNVVIAPKGKYFAGKEVSTEDEGHVATASYVKGAYNSAISAINKVASEIENNVETTLGDYATKPGVVATVNEASASGNVSVTLEDVTPTGTVRSELRNGAFTGSVRLPGSVTAVTSWGDDTNTTNVPLNSNASDTQISGTVSADVSSTFTGNVITGATATGRNTLDVSVDQYYATAPVEP